MGVVQAGSGETVGLVLAVGGQEDDADLLLLNGGLGGALDASPDLGDAGAFGGVGGDGDGLDEEFVFAADVEGRVLFHGLEQDLDLDGAGRLDAARVGAHAVSGRVELGLDRRRDSEAERSILLRRGGLDFEGDRLIAGVVQAQDLGDLVGKGAWDSEDCQP